MSKSISSLTDKQKQFLIKKFALTKSYIEIKREFEEFYKAEISGEMIQEVEEACLGDIEEEKARQYLKYVTRGMEKRLQEIEKGIQETSERRLIRSTKVGKSEDGSEEFHEEFGMDHANRTKYLDLHRREEYEAKRFMLEHAKTQAMIRLNNTPQALPVTDQNKLLFSPVIIDVGINEETTSN